MVKQKQILNMDLVVEISIILMEIHLIKQKMQAFLKKSQINPLVRKKVILKDIQFLMMQHTKMILLQKRSKSKKQKQKRVICQKIK